MKVTGRSEVGAFPHSFIRTMHVHSADVHEVTVAPVLLGCTWAYMLLLPVAPPTPAVPKLYYSADGRSSWPRPPHREGRDLEVTVVSSGSGSGSGSERVRTLTEARHRKGQ